MCLEGHLSIFPYIYTYIDLHDHESVQFLEEYLHYSFPAEYGAMYMQLS